MKLKNVKIKKYKLMRLYLAKYEAYKNENLSFIAPESALDRLEIGFKKVLFIIYQYHIYNKRILFVGFPHTSDKKLLSVLLSSNHIFVPRAVWKSGFLGNKESISKKYLNFFYFKKFLGLKYNPHLIVLFNEEKLQSIVPECKKLSIPTIYFGKFREGLRDITYVVEGNFINRRMKNFFQFLIYSILKKSKNNSL